MNTNHKKNKDACNLLKLFYNLSLQHEKGTFLVASLAFGLVLIILAMTAILRSSRSQINTVVNVASQQSLSITEAGVSNMIAQLTTPSTRGLLLRSFDPNGLLEDPAIDEWTNTSIDLTLSGGVNSCNTTADDAAKELDTITVDPGTGNPSIVDVPVGEGDGSGTYKMMAYRFEDPDKIPNTGDEYGKMMIEGKLSKQSDSRTRLVVEFPVEQVVEFPVEQTVGNGPAIWADNINMQDSDGIASSIVCNDPDLCSLDCTISGNANDADFDDLKEAIGGSSSSVIQSPEVGVQTFISVGDSTIPPIPAVPSDCTSTINNLGTVSSNITLPRTSPADNSCSIDIDGDGINETVYYYELTGINQAAIWMSDPNAEYRLYIDGSIDQKGNDDIRLTDSTTTPNPGQIRVYGGRTDGSEPTSVTQWELGGNACNMAFIHAPTLDIGIIGIKGEGNGCSDIDVDDAVADANSVYGAGTYNFNDPKNTNIYGAVWAKSYNVIGNPSNSAVFYEQPGLMAVLNQQGIGFSGFDSIHVNYIQKRERREIEKL